MFDVQSQMTVDIPEHCIQLAFNNDNECHAFHDWIMGCGLDDWERWWERHQQDYME